MTRKEYEKKKENQKGIYLARVFRHGTDNPDKLLKEALKKFEKEYPKYEGS